MDSFNSTLLWFFLALKRMINGISARANNIENAWSNETGTISGFETALKDLIASGHNVLSMVGWGYALFGIGFILVGIGVLVYLVRKFGTPKAS
jgi:hypothetical protein